MSISRRSGRSDSLVSSSNCLADLTESSNDNQCGDYEPDGIRGNEVAVVIQRLRSAMYEPCVAHTTRQQGMGECNMEAQSQAMEGRRAFKCCGREVEHIPIELSGRHEDLGCVAPPGLRQDGISGQEAARSLCKSRDSLHADDKTVPGGIPGVCIGVLFPCMQNTCHCKFEHCRRADTPAVLYKKSQRISGPPHAGVIYQESGPVGLQISFRMLPEVSVKNLGFTTTVPAYLRASARQATLVEMNERGMCGYSESV